jgi:peptidoglycan hydrolase-like protein with peptidoglycan-binding domain
MLPIILKSVAAKIIATGALGFGGYEAWKHFYPKLQSLRTVSSSGHPVQVVVPVKPLTLRMPIKSQTISPVPSNNGTQNNFIPPPSAPTGRVANEPTVITPTGSANLSVDNVSDVQNALNALGWTPALKPDGILGPLTSSAISSFEQSHGLPVDGQTSAGLRTAIQGALSRVAGTQAHIGQSLPVQSAPQTVNASASPVAEVATVAIQSPAAKSLINSGLSAVASLFSDSGDDSADTSADTPSNSPKKDAIQSLQHALNMLGSSPPLKEDGNFNDETVAAVRAFQIVFGMASDGIPGPKTATAMAVALDPSAQQVIVPSVAKAADHVDAVAAAAPPTTAPVLANAAADLKATAATTPVPTEVQTHASTAAAQAATASSAAPPGVAEPLADASHSLAAATTTPVPDPTHLATAAAAVSQAAVAATGSTSAPSLAAAADHIASAAAAPDTATQGDHLNAAAAHLANAATGAPSPASTQVAASGEFGGFASWLSNWWKSPDHFWHWHSRMHPTYAPAIPAPPPAPMHGEWAKRHIAFGGEWAKRHISFGREGRRHHHHRNWQQQQGGMQQPAPPPPQDTGDFGWDRGIGGMGRSFRDRQFMMMQQDSPWEQNPWDSDFGAVRPSAPTGYRPSAPTGYAGVPSAPTGYASSSYRPAPPTGQIVGGVFQPTAYGQSLGYQPGRQDNSAYWNARNQTLGGYGVPYDRRWSNMNAQQTPDGDWRRRREWERIQRMQQMQNQPPPGIDPNAINPYIDPNANNPAVMDPSLDSMSNGGAPQADGSTDDGS